MIQSLRPFSFVQFSNTIQTLTKSVHLFVSFEKSIFYGSSLWITSHWIQQPVKYNYLIFFSFMIWKWITHNWIDSKDNKNKNLWVIKIWESNLKKFTEISVFIFCGKFFQKKEKNLIQRSIFSLNLTCVLSLIYTLSFLDSK